MERLVIKQQGIMRTKIIYSIVILLSFCFNASPQTIPAWKIADLEAYVRKSNTPVIINFWATFCVPCLKEIPDFERTIKKYKKEQVSILLVSLDMKDQYPRDINVLVRKMKFVS